MCCFLIRLFGDLFMGIEVWEVLAGRLRISLVWGERLKKGFGGRGF